MIGIPGITLPKAKIEMYRGDEPEPVDTITVMFNPPEYSISKGARYASTSILGMSTPLTQFVHGEADTLSLELFLDTTLMLDLLTDSDVREFVAKLEKLVLIDPESHAPLHCKFKWGKVDFKATVAKLDTTYTKFNADGVPVRAKIRMTFTEYETFDEIKKKKKSKKESADLARTYVVKEGDSLWLIAYEQYGDQKYWKHIARANGVANPLEVEPGTEIKLPRTE
jgi:LysM repeat protein